MAKTNLQNKSTKPILLIPVLLTILSLLNLTPAAAAADDGLDTFSTQLSPKKLGLKREKLSQLHFYFHDTVSGRHPSAVHVAGPKMVNSTPEFGMTVILDDPLTVGPKPTSKQVGRAQGLYSAASKSDLGLLMALNFVFTEGKYNGSALGIFGHNTITEEVREFPIVGGSGLFRYARGYALAKTHWFNPATFDAIVEYKVYVFHY